MTLLQDAFGTAREDAFWEALLNECPIKSERAKAATTTLLAVLADAGWVLERADATSTAYRQGYADALDAHGIGDDITLAEEETT